MVNTHEIKLGVVEFENFRNNSYIILPVNDLEVEDYILFKQVMQSDDGTVETGLHQMTKITGIVTDKGLKDGYALITFNKL